MHDSHAQHGLGLNLMVRSIERALPFHLEVLGAESCYGPHTRTQGTREAVLRLSATHTRKEALDYHHYIVHEKGDWEAAEYGAAFRGQRVNTWMREEKDLKARLISGAGYPVVGSYDDAAETIKTFSEMGLDGVAMGMINYIDDFPHIRDGLIPRLERLGLREPVKR